MTSPYQLVTWRNIHKHTCYTCGRSSSSNTATNPAVNRIRTVESWSALCIQTTHSLHKTGWITLHMSNYSILYTLSHCLCTYFTTELKPPVQQVEQGNSHHLGLRISSLISSFIVDQDVSMAVCTNKDIQYVSQWQKLYKVPVDRGIRSHGKPCLPNL